MSKGVYKITCLATNMVYIGSSTNVERRLEQHKVELANNTHGNYKLQAAYNTYGKEVFTCQLVEECNHLNRDQIYDREQHWLDTTSNKFNILNDARGHLKIRCEKVDKPKLKKIISKSKSETKYKKVKKNGKWKTVIVKPPKPLTEKRIAHLAKRKEKRDSYKAERKIRLAERGIIV